MCVCVDSRKLTIQQKVFHVSAFALIPIMSLELEDKRSCRGLRGHYSQVRVRLHIPLRDVVIDISDLQLHLVQVPVRACGIMQR